MLQSNPAQSKQPLTSSLTSPQHFHQTLQIKNTHITQLLQQLKKTQQLHTNLKKKYLAEEQKLKEKMGELQRLVEELRSQNTELLKKYRELEISQGQGEVRFRKVGSEWEKEMQGLRLVIERLKFQNAEIRTEKTQLQHRLKSEILEKQRAHTKIRQLSQEVKKLQAEIVQLNEKHAQKQEEWKHWSSDMRKNLKQIQVKSSERKIKTLNQLQSRIKGIMSDL